MPATKKRVSRRINSRDRRGTVFRCTSVSTAMFVDNGRVRRDTIHRRCTPRRGEPRAHNEVSCTIPRVDDTRGGRAQWRTLLAAARLAFGPLRLALSREELDSLAIKRLLLRVMTPTRSRDLLRERYGKRGPLGIAT